MKKLTAISIAAMLLATVGAGCNSSTYVPPENTSASVAVYSFTLSADDSIMAGLDTVFFTIDLANARIFNADSLPVGTRVDALVPVIRVVENVSAATLTVKRDNDADTTFDYLSNPDDSIDFTHPVTLSLTSPSGAAKRDYTVQVNVHKMTSDSLEWARSDRRNLPSAFNVPTRQHTARTADAYYCLTQAGSSWSMASAEHPEADWTVAAPALPAGADINSFCATRNALYILADGILHTSPDGIAWTSTGLERHSLYGGYGDILVGNVKTPTGFETALYPGDTRIANPSKLPITGTSMPVNVRFDIASEELMLVTGGIVADGARSADTWGFDGRSWMKISTKPLPAALSGIAMVPFTTFRIIDVINVLRYSSMLAIGGTDGSTVSRTVYVSNDYGMAWAEGGSLIQLPDYMPAVHGAQAFVEDETLTASRATRPITEWQCPYIYLFGGTRPDGTLSNSIWRGTINRLTFKPLQ